MLVGLTTETIIHNITNKAIKQRLLRLYETNDFTIIVTGNVWYREISTTLHNAYVPHSVMEYLKRFMKKHYNLTYLYED